MYSLLEITPQENLTIHMLIQHPGKDQDSNQNKYQDKSLIVL